MIGGGGNQISSRKQTVITIDADDTLDSLVTKINNESPELTAAVINDGSSFNAFRLSLTSRIWRSAGHISSTQGIWIWV